jgi:hypothetical protein
VIRPAVLADLPAIIDLSVESVSKDPLPGVVIDRAAMADTARAAIGNPAHFAWVAEVDGVVVASVLAVVQPGFWFRRLQCSVLLFYSRGSISGTRLLKKFAEWVKSRSAIKLAVFELEPGVDERLVVMLKKLGFARESRNLTFVRGAQ